jgi:hypothetical protein
MDLDLIGVTTSSISAIQPMRPRSGGRRPPPEPDRAAVTDQIERQRRNVMLARFGPECAPRDLGIAFTDDLRERSVAVYHASPSEGGRGHEAGASTAYVDDACSLDPETGLF